MSRDRALSLTELQVLLAALNGAEALLDALEAAGRIDRACDESEPAAALAELVARARPSVERRIAVLTPEPDPVPFPRPQVRHE